MLVGSALHVDKLIHELRLQPFSIYFVFIRPRRIKRLYVKVLYVRAIVRKSPRNPVVVTNHHQRRARQREPFHIPARARQMHLVPDRRNA